MNIGTKWIKTDFWGDFCKNTGNSKTEYAKIWKDETQYVFYKSQEEEVKKIRQELKNLLYKTDDLKLLKQIEIELKREEI